MNNPSIADDPAKDPKYAEPAIDSLRTQKDEVSRDTFGENRPFWFLTRFNMN